MALSRETLDALLADQSEPGRAQSYGALALQGVENALLGPAQAYEQGLKKIGVIEDRDSVIGRDIAAADELARSQAAKGIPDSFMGGLAAGLGGAAVDVPIALVNPLALVAKAGLSGYGGASAAQDAYDQMTPEQRTAAGLKERPSSVVEAAKVGGQMGLALGGGLLGQRVLGPMLAGAATNVVPKLGLPALGGLGFAAGDVAGNVAGGTVGHVLTHGELPNARQMGENVGLGLGFAPGAATHGARVGGILQRMGVEAARPLDFRAAMRGEPIAPEPRPAPRLEDVAAPAPVAETAPALAAPKPLLTDRVEPPSAAHVQPEGAAFDAKIVDQLFPTEELNFHGGQKTGGQDVTRVSPITNDAGKLVYLVEYKRNGESLIGYSDNPVWEAHSKYEAPAPAGASAPTMPAAVSGTGLAGMGRGIAGAISENMRAALTRSVDATGELPPTEAKSLIGQVFRAVREARQDLSPSEAIREALSITDEAKYNHAAAEQVFKQRMAAVKPPPVQTPPSTTPAAVSMPEFLATLGALRAELPAESRAMADSVIRSVPKMLARETDPVKIAAIQQAALKQFEAMKPQATTDLSPEIAAELPGLNLRAEGVQPETGTRSFTVLEPEMETTFDVPVGATLADIKAAKEQALAPYRFTEPTGLETSATPKPPQWGELTPQADQAIREAYGRLAEKTGLNDVRILELAREANLPVEQVRKWVQDAAAKGEANLATGNWPDATPQERAAAVEQLGKPRLYVSVPKAKAAPDALAVINREIEALKSKATLDQAQSKRLADLYEQRKALVGEPVPQTPPTTPSVPAADVAPDGLPTAMAGVPPEARANPKFPEVYRQFKQSEEAAIEGMSGATKRMNALARQLKDMGVDMRALEASSAVPGDVLPKGVSPWRAAYNVNRALFKLGNMAEIADRLGVRFARGEAGDSGIRYDIDTKTINLSPGKLMESMRGRDSDWFRRTLQEESIHSAFVDALTKEAVRTGQSIDQIVNQYADRYPALRHMVESFYGKLPKGEPGQNPNFPVLAEAQRMATQARAQGYVTEQRLNPLSRVLGQIKAKFGGVVGSKPEQEMLKGIMREVDSMLFQAEAQESRTNPIRYEEGVKPAAPEPVYLTDRALDASVDNPFLFRTERDLRAYAEGRKGAFLQHLQVAKDGTVPEQSLRAQIRKTTPKLEQTLLEPAIAAASEGGRTNVLKLAKAAADIREASMRVEELPARIEQMPEASRRAAELEHRLDTMAGPLSDEEAARLIPEFKALLDELTALREASPTFLNSRPEAATANFDFVNPKPLAEMPGARDIVIEAPGATRTEKHYPTRKGVIGFGRMYDVTLPNGAKCTFLFEGQSDWARDRANEIKMLEEMRRNALRNGDDALAGRRAREIAELKAKPRMTDIYEPLVLKAAIDSAIRRGQDYIILPDAETAMMIEGHDRNTVPTNAATGAVNLGRDVRVGDWGARDSDGSVSVFPSRQSAEQAIASWNRLGNNFTLTQVAAKDLLPRRPSQEAGMRAHYDPREGTMHARARALTGSKGEPVNLGPLRNSQVEGPSPVFKNADGTPKGDITAVAYPLAKLKAEMARDGGLVLEASGQPGAITTSANTAQATRSLHEQRDKAVESHAAFQTDLNQFVRREKSQMEALVPSKDLREELTPITQVIYRVPGQGHAGDTPNTPVVSGKLAIDKAQLQAQVDTMRAAAGGNSATGQPVPPAVQHSAKMALPIYERALETVNRAQNPLTPADAELNQALHRGLTAIRQKAEDMRALDMAMGRDYGPLENYIQQVHRPLDDGYGATYYRSPGPGGSKAPFKERVYRTYFDAIMNGREPVTLDAAELIAHRWGATERAYQMGQHLDRLMAVKMPESEDTTLGPRLQAEQKRQLAGQPPREVRPEQLPMVQRVNVGDAPPADYMQVNPQAIGRHDIYAHPKVAGLINAMLGTSKLRQSALGNALLQTWATVKHGMLAFDSFHGARMLQNLYAAAMLAKDPLKAFKDVFEAGRGLGAAFTGNKVQRGKYGYGLDYNKETLDYLKSIGELTPEAYDAALKFNILSDYGSGHGLEIGRITDNLFRQLGEGTLEKAQNAVLGKVPLGEKYKAFLERFNRWIFDGVTRSSILAGFDAGMTYELGAAKRADFDSIIAKPANQRTPEEAARLKGYDATARKLAKEVNYRFGNAGKQLPGFRDSTFQDMAALASFAPQWAYTQAVSEGLGYAQAGKYAWNVGKHLTEGQFRKAFDERAGFSAAVMGRGLLMMMVAAAVGNAITRKILPAIAPSLAPNDEGGMKDWMATYVPAGKNGLYIPLTPPSMEWGHALAKYAGESRKTGLGPARDALARQLSNKVHPVTGALIQTARGKDYAGRDVGLGQAAFNNALSLLPIPIAGRGLAAGVGNAIEDALGYDFGTPPTRATLGEELTKGAISSLAGFHAEPGKSPTARLFDKAVPFMTERVRNEDAKTSPYYRLKASAVAGSDGDLQRQVRALLDQGYTAEQIKASVRSPSSYTRNSQREAEFRASVPPKLFEQAAIEQAQIQERVGRALAQVLANPKPVRPQVEPLF